MTMAHVGVARPIDVDPASQAESVLFPGCFGTEVIEERLDVQFHLVSEFVDDRFLQFEKIERIVPAPGIRPFHVVANILAQATREFLQSLVQMHRSVTT